MTTSAAIYLRSSKDRHDLSIQAQRLELHKYAKAHGFGIVAEYTDAVESGKDENRPGFQELLTALKHPNRSWSAVIAMDTSRIARRRHIALLFEHECEKVSVKVIYRTLPDTDPITGMLLRSILQAMDEWHSLTSRAKGLAGMAESVRQGWRAGGCAPYGYDLQHSPTGTMRDGKPVMRSRLIPNADIETVGMYLRLRASGKSRSIAKSISGIGYKSLNDLEWNALTYAGHTVWGMSSGGKRCPREDWHITRSTHQAVITDEDAEAVLARLENRRNLYTRGQCRTYLLTGLLESPSGEAFIGDTTRGSPNYRLGKRRRISATLLDAAVLDVIFTALVAPDVAHTIMTLMRASNAPRSKPRDLDAMRRRVKGIEQKIGRLVDLAAEDAELAPTYRRHILELERDRETMQDELDTAQVESAQAQVLALWTVEDVRKLLGSLRQSLESELACGNIEEVKNALHLLVERIVYDVDERSFVVQYQLSTGVALASPRGFEPLLPP